MYHQELSKRPLIEQFSAEMLGIIIDVCYCFKGNVVFECSTLEITDSNDKREVAPFIDSDVDKRRESCL